MDFRQAIAAYQTGGDRTIIKQILSYMRDRSESRVVLPGDDASIYVALRAISVTYHERKALEYEPAALFDYRESIYEFLGVDILRGPDFSEFRTHASTIRKYLGAHEYEALIYALERWLDYGVYERSTILPALEHALTSVDVSRSEREVVSYANRAFETEYRRLFMLESGMVRLGRRDDDGQFRNVYVKPLAANPWRIIFERRVSPEEAPQILRKLTARQRDYVERAYAVVAADIEDGELGEYKVSESGEYRLKIRYMAEKLGVEESTLRKCFHKVRDRASDKVPTIAY
ncbi:hypothetical protein NSS98_21240 [Paenibacillus sp. FSL E2-0274]|uniref:hypothetical protein n=1 Tax=Paenibacillus TaxID=44249 RepID=UPI00096E39F3|nr:hypothetical protein [Paenibacillus odorifer]OME31783.1 hypothetical protein BSK63_14625 [Paenibacillus odorifer]OME37897.1 hypothetical protein BSK46_14310 [Paenibacillus odorifer]